MATPEQIAALRLAHLKKADRIRHLRAQLKRDLKAGRIPIGDILLDPPEEVETMTLYNVLISCPTYGQTKVNKVLKRSKISPMITIGKMTPRQRNAIVEMMETRYWEIPPKGGS